MGREKERKKIKGKKSWLLGSLNRFPHIHFFPVLVPGCPCVCTSLTSRQILKLPDAGHLLLITGGPELLKIIRRKAGLPLPAGAWPRPGPAAHPCPAANPCPAERGAKARAEPAREGGGLAPPRLEWYLGAPSSPGVLGWSLGMFRGCCQRDPDSGCGSGGPAPALPKQQQTAQGRDSMIIPKGEVLKDLVGIELAKEVGNHLCPSLGVLEKTCRSLQLPLIADWGLAAAHQEPQGRADTQQENPYGHIWDPPHSLHRS